MKSSAVAGKELPSEPQEDAGLVGNLTTAAVSDDPTGEFLSLVAHEYARRHLVLSAGTAADNTERLLVGPATKPSVIFNVGVCIGRPVSTEIVDSEILAAKIDRAYAAHRSSAPATDDDDGEPMLVVQGSDNVEEELEAALNMSEQDLLRTDNKSATVRLVDLILFDALRAGASDVHIQPLRDRTLVRYRLDGALHTSRELAGRTSQSGEAGNLASGVISRIKVMGRLDIAERRSPQDGRASVTIGGSGGRTGAGAPPAKAQPGRRVDLRISILPSTYGERVVLRLLDPSRSPHTLSFSALGMPKTIESAYLAQVSKTSGIVLSTGPTGSGKTTTLYATLAWLSATNLGKHARGCELNIMTIEDPVEYDLCGPGAAFDVVGGGGGGGVNARREGLTISQTQVNPKKNMTFASGLRHILRQDPDVIMVGEIRDQETARIAVQASLTGHLVLSTLHTFDAPSAVARLLDLGVEPFLASSSLTAVLAQRLARKRHAECQGHGCPFCMDTGFKGRIGLFELMVVSPELRSMIDRRASAVEIKDTARRAGMTTLYESGMALVLAQVTTREELARVIEASEELG